MKSVQDEAKNESKDTYLKGCIDLALEVKYLSSLSHPSILEVRGVASCGPFKEGYFIILDRLPEMLPKRLNRWMTVDRQTKGVTGLFTGGKNKVGDLLVERLVVAHDIASALGYLHEVRVVYRDLKPDNIGFDKHGKPKLFDFGLSKELNEDERTKDGLYRMTGFTGSIRYMSPEVGTGKPYNEKTDVYSFGILLWYFMALEPPFGLFTDRLILERVPKGNRPVLMDAWPDGVKSLINRCWSGKIKSRPSFKTVMKLLKDEVAPIDTQKVREMTHYPAKQPVDTSIELPIEASIKHLERSIEFECFPKDTQDC
jgi:serine/threonine protein kinase